MMPNWIWFFWGVLLLSQCGGEKNTFAFCRDFTPEGCSEVFSDRAIYPLLPSRRDGTLRDFWNSIYFRGDRLAFALRNAYSRYSIDFDCLHGHYSVQDRAQERENLDYLELRGNDVYGLVMLGNLLEKLLSENRNHRYFAPPPFRVSYAIFCRNDLLARAAIVVELR
ncbi:MAG: hypothetical protein NZL89_03495 [Leptospiraceae bacterium]|nr:hypothetical protein [Leptospiraceae bacterium]